MTEGNGWFTRMLVDASAKSRDETLHRLADGLRRELGEDADVRVEGDAVIVGGQNGREYGVGGRPFVISTLRSAAGGQP